MSFVLVPITQYIIKLLLVLFVFFFYRLEWDRWVMMAFIGVSVGLIGFILHQIIDVIADFKWDKAREYIEV